MNVSGIKWRDTDKSEEKENDSMGKEEFVRELTKFYKEKVNNVIGIEDLKYRVVDGKEFVYVFFPSGGVKRFCIDGDNNQGILVDFTRFIKNQQDYAWLF